MRYECSVTPDGTRVTSCRQVTSTWHVLLCQVMLSREDLVVSVQNPDGSLSVEHADGTRITSLYQDKPPKTLQHILQHTGDQHTVNTHCSKDRSYTTTHKCTHTCKLNL